MSEKIIAWWSGGVTSAVACKLAIEMYSDVDVVMIDTHNEDPDTYRFKMDCQTWYGQSIKVISAIPEKYSCIQDVWYRYNSLNVANGAICSTDLKRQVRERFQNTLEYKHQVFGFDIDEPKRAKMLSRNYKESKAIHPLLLHALTKKDCIKIIEDQGIQLPRAYRLGFLNNNCLQTGCVQGGIGYWQKVKRDFPEKFDEMARVEHELTDRKGSPVTMLKDQSKEAKKTGNFQVFLKPHKDYPLIKDISMMKGVPPKPLMECNGFCGVNSLLPPNETENEINFQQD